MKRKGAMLVEVLISITIISTFLLISSSFFNQQKRMNKKILNKMNNIKNVSSIKQLLSSNNKNIDNFKIENDYLYDSEGKKATETKITKNDLIQSSYSSIYFNIYIRKNQVKYNYWELN